MAVFWWGWLESNQLPRRYERPALTDELHPLENFVTFMQSRVLMLAIIAANFSCPFVQRILSLNDELQATRKITVNYSNFVV